jgi:hypothetical protein
MAFSREPFGNVLVPAVVLARGGQTLFFDEVPECWGYLLVRSLGLQVETTRIR